MGFRDGNILLEPTDEVPRRRGTQEDAASGQPAPPNAKGRSAPSPRPGCAIEDFPGQPEGLTDPADRGQRGRGALVHQPPSAAPRRAPILRGTQGTGQERQAWRRGQLSTGESGCWGKGSRAPPRALRASVSPAGMRSEHGVRPRP